MRYIRLLLVLLAVLLACISLAEKWCFVVTGDGRSDPNAHPARAMDKDGVNVVITGELANAVVKEHAKFLLWTGDLVLGYSDAGVFEKELRRWRETMEPVYSHHIPVLAVRGNHEEGAKQSIEVWDKVFTGPDAMPSNGSPGEQNLSFYYTHGNVLVVGLDEYCAGKEVIDQGWLDDVLREHHKPFVFVMGHEEAFMAGHHTDTMDAHPANRDTFWESLISSGARVFFAGHDHFYDHMVVTRDGADPGPEMHQFVGGTAGAPFYVHGAYEGNNTVWKLRRVKEVNKTYGYVLVTIDGNKTTITFKGRTKPGVYKAMDTFSYTVK